MDTPNANQGLVSLPAGDSGAENIYQQIPEKRPQRTPGNNPPQLPPRNHEEPFPATLALAGAAAQVRRGYHFPKYQGTMPNSENSCSSAPADSWQLVPHDPQTPTPRFGIPAAIESRATGHGLPSLDASAATKKMLYDYGSLDDASRSLRKEISRSQSTLDHIQDAQTSLDTNSKSQTAEATQERLAHFIHVNRSNISMALQALGYLALATPRHATYVQR